MLFRSILFQERNTQRTYQELCDEIKGLKNRRSNIDEKQIELRRRMCSELNLSESEMPFAGELIQVRDADRDWEGAIERLLHNFGLSLLVPERAYAQVAEWVDRTNLHGRLVYFRVRSIQGPNAITLHEQSLVNKLNIKPDSNFYDWMYRELSHRFDIACCTSHEQFRREPRAITRSGQIKSSGERHEKDDRKQLNDRSHYVLGWSNHEKIQALEHQANMQERQLSSLKKQKEEFGKQLESLKVRLDTITKLSEYTDFTELDWQPITSEIARLVEEKVALETTNNVLKELASQMEALTHEAEETSQRLRNRNDKRSKTEQQIQDKEELRSQTSEILLDRKNEDAPVYVQIEALRIEAVPDQSLTVENIDVREREMREWLQARIDSEDKKVKHTAEKIIQAMAEYKKIWVLETREVDVQIEAGPEYARMLQRLKADDLPKFEGRFKELLNENTIREVANFQSQLHRERESISERIMQINQSLTQIDYNPGRFIRLEAQSSQDAEIREFQAALRACTEGALTGSEDAQYSESKFLQVKRMIERFQGRVDSADLDRRWTDKVTDVRNWFLFAASERWREDDAEFEHYTDSSGKSGGQKEKLAYTVLAASLAYQFGLEWGAVRSRSFRFVVIDEAFGRGSDESAQYGLRLFAQLNLQLLIVTPLQKIHIIEPFVSNVGFVYNDNGNCSVLRNITMKEYREEKQRLQ